MPHLVFPVMCIVTLCKMKDTGPGVGANKMGCITKGNKLESNRIMRDYRLGGKHRQTGAPKLMSLMGSTFITRTNKEARGSWSESHKC